MTGLEEIQALIARGRRPPMLDLMGIDLVEVAEGRVVFVATPRSAHYNPMGTVHGGFAATMLDSACGLAASSAMREARNCITLEIKIVYHRAMTETTGTVRAIGEVLSVGSRVATTEAKLLDGAQRLLASATSTLLLVER